TEAKRNSPYSVPTVSSPTGRNEELVTALYENCRFILDSDEEANRIPFARERLAFKLTFKHCQIVYRGGGIRLLSPNPRPNALTSKGNVRTDVYIIQGQTIYFEDCLFLFAIESK